MPLLPVRDTQINTLIDTSNDTCQRAGVERTKRTCNLPTRTVQLVREIASDYGLAPTQDALVELAVDELARRVRDEREAELWAGAAEDPEFRGEAAAIERAFGTADLETWPAQ